MSNLVWWVYFFIPISNANTKITQLASGHSTVFITWKKLTDVLSCLPLEILHYLMGASILLYSWKSYKYPFNFQSLTNSTVYLAGMQLVQNPEGNLISQNSAKKKKNQNLLQSTACSNKKQKCLLNDKTVKRLQIFKKNFKNSHHHHHHHHVGPPAQISLTLFRHFSLSFIASGRSS